jgi:antibiotic biosynthesis monooxygenase (ABM) superfamily enzyme
MLNEIAITKIAESALFIILKIVLYIVVFNFRKLANPHLFLKQRKSKTLLLNSAVTVILIYYFLKYSKNSNNLTGEL